MTTSSSAYLAGRHLTVTGRAPDIQRELVVGTLLAYRVEGLVATCCVTHRVEP
jgi:uncharacterized membrane protein (DUF441 family)